MIAHVTGMPGTVHVVLGMALGDEGKGTLVDWLARRADAAGERVVVVRWNGGPQAAHHVVTPEGRAFCFSQLGAGSFVAGARTHLGREMLVDPIALEREAAAFGPGVLARVSIDPRALVVTPWHATVNRIREVARGAGRHGSTGCGIAETRLGSERGEVSLRFGDGDRRRTLEAIRDAAIAKVEAIPHERTELDDDLRHPALLALTEDAMARVGAATTTRDALPEADVAIFEGAQGALLDRDHGDFPWVTPSRITRVAAGFELTALGLDPEDKDTATFWGVVRAYATRHGAGPFPTEDEALTRALPELHNPDGPWQGRMRVGGFDAVLFARALAFAGPIDRLAVTCLDRIRAVPELPIRTAEGTRWVPTDDRYLPTLEAIIGRRADLVSRGPTALDKELR